MERFQVERNRLDREQENSNGEYERMKQVCEKKIQLYNRYLTEDDLTDVDRLMLGNKREWIMSHLLSLIMEEENTNTFSDLTKRVHSLEKKTAELEEYIKDSNGNRPQNSNVIPTCLMTQHVKEDFLLRNAVGSHQLLETRTGKQKCRRLCQRRHNY